ncbi:hypothetical protein [Polaromonas sp.]|uniref:hypothetical protein n=1 Tax=Polaromonas sp. TaxID=1869339 RepID=UPI00286A1867|nr:hypothetical protein [Polaromonas sp.]
MNKFMPVSIALALAAPFCAVADTPSNTPSDIQGLRQEVDAMRAAYEARLQALEQRLMAAERVAEQAQASRSAAASEPGSISSTAPPPASQVTAAASSAAGGANAFNPAISLILSGGYTGTSQDPATYRITGVQLPTDSAAGPGSRGFSLAESELGLTANIDPWLRGVANISLHADDTVSVEEAFIQTTSLGHGLSLKAGRFFSGVGYLNPQHAHTWDFADNPLAYQAFLGTQYGDDGVQLNWLAPTDQYLELGLELGRGRGFPGSNTGRNGAGMTALIAHTGGDIGDSQNWRAGISRLATKANNQSLTSIDVMGNMVTNAFSGNTSVWVVDGVWKWAPNGNATQTNFKLQGEYLRSNRSGSLSYDVGNANVPGAYRAVQSGWYLQGIYQFMPSWRVGLRTERLNPGRPDFGTNAASLANSGYQPSKNSLMLDYNPSEFSRVRLQFAQDRSRQGLADNQVFLQYQMSLGAHGAHRY